jgi:hypothetical protein
MKKNYTDIIVVLDRSGSMESIKSDTIGGVNHFIADQKGEPGEARWTLTQFDNEYEILANGIPIKDAKNLTERTYVPRGNTALFGAIGRTIDEAGRRFEAMPEKDRPEKVVFLIVTDGLENASHQHEWSKAYTQERVRQMIQLQSGVYQWQFVYIGANQDAILKASELGINRDNALNYAGNSIGTHALYASATSNVKLFRSGVKATMSWEKKQRDEQDKAKGSK